MCSSDLAPTQQITGETRGFLGLSRMTATVMSKDGRPAGAELRFDPPLRLEPNLLTRDFLRGLSWSLAGARATEGEVTSAVAALLAADEVQVERMTKSGVRRFDARAAVLQADVSAAPQETGESGSGTICAIISLVVRHGAPTVRPDDVLAALTAVAGFAPPVPPRITRLAQGPLLEDGWSVGDPLAADRQS